MADRNHYRPDIDGLRAVAVLGVIAYHYGAAWLPGGFTGVDVFFVISGYLITSLVFREIEAESFSFREFWMRRVRRIMPALLVMILVSLGLGWLIIMPGDLVSLGNQAATATFGVSNFYFWRTSGYFDQVADLIPLLHTWSLGVEEQFYLLWPMFLLVAWRMTRRRAALVSWAVAVVAFVSFGLCLYLTSTRPVAAFYLAPPRGWELALGAALSFVPRSTNGRIAFVASALGAVLIGMAFLSISARAPFPGWAALLPCLGASLLIYGGGQAHRLTTLASAKPLVFLGKLSYSLYLWHWPIWVFYRHFNNSEPPDPWATALLVVATLVISYLSWRFVEQPFRRRSPTKRTLGAFGTLAAGVLIAFAGIGATDGGQWRIPDRLRGMDSLETMWAWECPRAIDLPGQYAALGGVCTFGSNWDTAEQRIILWGDSHAEHMAPLLQALIGDRNISVRLLRLCAATISNQVQYTRADIPGYTEGCDRTRDLTIDYMNADPGINTVVLAGYWAPLVNVLHEEGKQAGSRSEGLRLLEVGLRSVIRDAAQPERRFFVIMDVPHFRGIAPSTCNDPEALLLRRSCPPEEQGLSREAHLAEKGDILSALQRLASSSVQVVDTGAGLCASGTCQTFLNGEFLYRDVHHIRRNLAEPTRTELARLLGLGAIVDAEGATVADHQSQ